MELLDNPVRAYAWGSRTVIADLLGHEVPSPHPQAELWFGAHPGDPSRLVHADGSHTSLLDALRSDPERLLGVDRRGHWDSTLPFLLKVLAADEPLSLQAHPSIEQARTGFAREEAAGLSPDAADRNYRDPNHKPELICALTDFHALVGFREPAVTVRLLRELEVPELAGHAELLAAQPDHDGLRALFTTWITLPQSMLDTLVPALQEGCVRLAGSGGEFHVEARTVLELSERYPGDAGVLAALLLNRVTLQPGEALYLPAGNLHAYLSGAGIELMANSDNVLRGGLTPKHVDVPELLRVLDFTAGPPPVLTGSPDGGWIRYDTPAKEFLLRRWAGGPTGPVTVPDGGPRILLCTSGSACVRAPGEELEISRGGSLWMAAAETGVSVIPMAEDTQLFLAGDGLG
ncbi:mannose-6-phosphate isomerase, class I [Pseudonocardia xinjiangensis]|uniref:mannose-6-phosphate isomerase, class I n=1 Tax=Pseudonocardia xinjiangensis TaxID=75289 RepID=UPI003D8B065C